MNAATAATTDLIYGSSSTKNRRRTKAEIEAICNEMYAVLKREHPAPVRHVFYKVAGVGLIEKTESEYNHTIVRLLVRMRLEGKIPFEWISDSTRWMRKPRTYNDMQDALEATVRAYRRALWPNQTDYVEIWCEKDAIASTLYEETSKWDAPLMVNRGQPSLTFLHEAARYLERLRKSCWIYYLGDTDRWGREIERKTEERLRQFAPDTEIHFKRIAVTLEQVVEWNLPTRPAKKGDSGEVVEVDAIEPTKLRELVREAINGHIDREVLETTLKIELEERESLRRMVDAGLPLR